MSLAAADFSQIPMSQNLGTTLARASDLANFMGSVEVSLEHVLLALCDDPDAEAVLTASRVDVQHLKAETHGYLNSLPRLPSGAGFGVSQALSRILEAAAAAARGSRRRDINGAIVLAAIVGEGRSAAAQILQVHGLTFDEAIRALQAALGAPARESLPDIRPTDDVLARARERVQSRAAPSLREMMKDAPRPVQPPPPPAPAPPQMAPQSQPIIEEPTPTPAVEAPPIAAAENEPTDVPPPPFERTMPSGDAGSSSDPAPAEEAEFELPEPKLLEAAIGSGVRIEPTLPGGVIAPEGPAAPAAPAEAPLSAGARPAQATDFGYPAAPALARVTAQPPPAPSLPFDLQRPAPIAMPPPIPPMPPQASPVFRGGPPTGFSAPPPPFAQTGPPPYPQPSPGPSMRGDPRATPPIAPYDPSRPPLPGAPALGPYGNTGGATAPTARDLHMPYPTQPQMAPGQPQGQRAARPKIEAGQLAENIPRAMRIDRTESVEIRIGKATAKAITQGLEGGGVAWRHEVTVTQAMSVRLRAPDGGFFIETASPETQWIENNLGFGSDDFASWRFHITPQFRGWSRLQIIVSARTIGSDGMAAETALPDQLVDVKVKTNYKRTFARWTGWTLAAIAGGILAKFGEGTLSVVLPLAEKFMK